MSHSFLAAEPATGRPQPDAVVRLEDVGKVFANGTVALSGLSLAIAPGEFLSLLGPSGCGKSTALRLIAGLSRPTSGSIAWPAARLDGRGLPRGEIGFVFQEPTLMPWQTVFGNVWLPLRLAGISSRQARPAVMEALAAVGLEPFARAYPRELSGGMKMRVAIARALVMRPRLLLMDEPFAALDEIARQQLNEDVLQLWRRTGLTVVFVTHSVFESAFLASRIVVMTPRPGRVFSDFAVAAPADRDARYRTSDAYHAVTAKVSRALQEAMQAGAAA
ncbi:ABC transporter ATP-binding protein [Devosia sp.]|uniref:ABC transporter ATP-binding protein n=1 Tax=Devosia sp. TaxID=1871048 RepID=UPI002EE0B2E6